MSRTSLILILSWIASLLLLHELVEGYRIILPHRRSAGCMEERVHAAGTLSCKKINKRFFMHLETSCQDSSLPKDRKWWRPLGSYEILLSRSVPKTHKLALSHSAAFRINTKIGESELLDAVCHVMKR